MQKIPENILKEIQKKFENGQNLTQLGKEYGINRKLISVELKELGYKIQRGYSDDIIQEAIALYEKGHSIRSIAQQLHVDSHQIGKKLAELGIREMAKPTDKNKWFVETEQARQIKNRYEQGMSISQLAKQIGKSTNYIHRILDHYGICQTNRLNRKYCFDETIFSNIDTEAKAYWLGFLMADGCINRISNVPQSVELSLQERDKATVQAFADFINATPPIPLKIKHTKIGQNAYRICVSSKILAADLVSHGCVIKKSLILQFPNFIKDSDLLRHFMRGYFDGDGTIYAPKKKQPCFSIVSTYDFCNVYNQMLVQHAGVNLTKIQCNRGLYYCSHGGKNQVRKIFDFLYKDATIYMERKYQKFASLYTNNIAV